MNSESFPDRRRPSVRQIGLLIAILASLFLFTFAAYRLPLFHEQLDGTIVGISEVHDKTGSELVAVVQLDTGVQVLVSMPRELLGSERSNVRVDEFRTLFGRKSYRLVTTE